MIYEIIKIYGGRKCEDIKKKDMNVSGIWVQDGKGRVVVF